MLEVMTEPLAPAAQKARQALREALDCEFETWTREEADRWRYLAEDALTESHLAAHYDGVLTPLLEEVFATGHTCFQASEDGSLLVAAPLTNPAGALEAVAAAAFDPSVGHVAARLADVTLRELAQRQEIEWLRDENYVFSHQVTDDFEELTFLRTMATRLVVDDTTLDIGRIVDRTISELREMIGAETIYFITSPTDASLEIAQSCPAKPDAEAPVENQIILRLARVHRARAAQSPCIKNDLSACDPDAARAGVRQFLMSPISIGGRQFGWFVAVNRTTIGRRWSPSPLLQLGHDEFGTWEASLLNTAATLLASHASNLELIREKEQLLVNTVRSLVTALDSKDAYTRGHSERVAMFSKRIAETLGYDARSARRLYLSGLLHDVGKIGVSDAVLRKPDKLTAEEFAEIKRHPDEGWSILRDLEQLSYVLPGVLHHHERVGGGGYPDGLVGEEIPLDARIMAVADAYDAMTSDRAYRAGMPHNKAIEILRQGAGSQWDEQVIDAFLSIIEDIIAIRYGYRQIERPPRQGSARTPSCQQPA
jgi:HD-GYP domain-containing protein (c-di-GMP phosphodiesterase class II)